MKTKTCLALFILGLVVAQAVPMAKIAKKRSLREDAVSDKKNDLKLEEPGSDKDRAKKAAVFRVEVRPGCSHRNCNCNMADSAQLNLQPHAAPVQTLNIVQPAAQAQQQPQVYNIVPQPQVQSYASQPTAQAQQAQSYVIQPAAQAQQAESYPSQPAAQAQQAQVQTYLVQPQADQQPCAQTQSFMIQPQSAPQPLNAVQSVPQSSQANIVLPTQQQLVQPVHTLHIVQQASQPCAQAPATVNLIQPAPQSAPQPQPQSAPQPAPKPEPVPETPKAEPTKPKPQPIHDHPAHEHAPIQTLNIVAPAEPACREQMVLVKAKPMVLVPEAERIQTFVPLASHQCHQHGPQQLALAECNCRPQKLSMYRSPEARRMMHFPY